MVSGLMHPQDLLRALARAFSDEHCASDVVRAVAGTPETCSRPLSGAVARLGRAGLAQSAGLAVLLPEAGPSILPSPLRARSQRSAA